MSPAPASEWLLGAGRAALDLVIAQECAGCGRPGQVWCGACEAAVSGPALVVPGVPECRAAAAHAGPAGRAVVAFKDSGTRRLAEPLGRLLAAAVLDVVGWRARGPVWIIPVPSRPAARRQRGSDHMNVLAGRAARVLRTQGVPANRYAGLQHVRASRDQVGLSRSQRRANLRGTLAAGPLPRGVLVVVDDVTTTGATLGEAARAIGARAGRRPLAATVTWAVPTPRLASSGRRD